VPELSSFNAFFVENLLVWYDRHKRDLPWRDTTDPYKVWISEIILQQTRVDQGLPYYHRFLKTFPKLANLADADEQLVLSIWQGLGYYSRARNLHQGAKQIGMQYKGKYPTSYQEWLKIKGVGSYTAAAIASFCFQEQVPVLDGNVFRVLSRVFGIAEDILSGKGKKLFWEKASELIPADRPDQFNQAIMEFGALHCTPKSPDCESCIFKSHCFAHQKNLVKELPVKLKKTSRKSRFFEYQVYVYRRQVLLKKRAKGDIWEGLNEFPLIEKKTLEDLNKASRQKVKVKLSYTSELLKHVLSHQDLHCIFNVYEVAHKTDWQAIQKHWEAESVPLAKITDIPKPVLLTKFLNTYFNEYISTH
jgi:A/G-specific adenine glycosylase